MGQHGSWSPLSGGSAIALAVVLFIIAAGLAFLATRMRGAIAVRRPGRFFAILIVMMWFLAGFTFVSAVLVYGAALVAQRPGYTAPPDHIFPFTFTFGVIAFFAILTLTQRRGLLVAVGSGLAGAIAAPMIFELPFDLIVLWRTFPPDPAALYTLLFFLPLVLVALLSYALAALAPDLRLSRWPLYALAAMFLTFGVWALFGFGYPLSPLPIFFNVVAKLLAFVAAVTLFLPPPKAAHEQGAATASQESGAADMATPATDVSAGGSRFGY